MIGAIVELVPIEVVAGKSEAELIAASDVFQRDFLALQPGFMHRELVRRGDNGRYLDIVRWRSIDDLKAAMREVENSAAFQEFASMMAVGAVEAMASNVEMCTSVAVYGT